VEGREIESTLVFRCTSIQIQEIIKLLKNQKSQVTIYLVYLVTFNVCLNKFLYVFGVDSTCAVFFYQQSIINSCSDVQFWCFLL